MNDTITITRVSPISRKTNQMTLDMTPQEYQDCSVRWAKGELIQDAFPTLNADEREFIKTGITPEEWDKLFGGDDE